MITGSLPPLPVPTSRRYRISDGVFHKTGLADPRGEFEKAEWLHELSMMEGFVAPRPLIWDEATGSLGSEYLKDLMAIRVHYLRYLQARIPKPETLELFREAGRVLAAIHRGTPPKSAVRWMASPEFRRDYEQWTGSSLDNDLSDVPLVPLHCDYGFSNVCVVRRQEGSILAVIDPSANGFVTFHSNLTAPPHVDVANFVACIEGLVPIRCYLRAKWARLPDLRSAFLDGYMKEACPLDSKVLSGMVFATASSYFRRKFGSELKKKLALLMLFNSWKGNVERS